MTNTDGGSKILKTDALGRVRTPAARREQLLDELEKSGVSGVKFARLTGLKYQTLATWLQARCLWTAHRPRGDVLRRWETSRAAACLENLVPVDFTGTIQCGGYSGYRAFAGRREQRITPAGCWAHVRRKLHDALEQTPRTAVRAHQSRPLIERFKKALVRLKASGRCLPQNLPGQATGKKNRRSPSAATLETCVDDPLSTGTTSVAYREAARQTLMQKAKTKAQTLVWACFVKKWRQPTLAESIKPLPSARLRLTAVFGMGTGRSTALWPPKIVKELSHLQCSLKTTHRNI